MHQVLEARERGYAVNISENRPHVCAVGAAVVDPSGRPVAAIAISPHSALLDGMPDEPSRAAAPQLLWTPDATTVDTARITAFLTWLRRERGIELDGYRELWQWSVADLAGFWAAVRVFFDVRFAAPAEWVHGFPPVVAVFVGTLPAWP